MNDFIQKWLKWRPTRDYNYYWGLGLLLVGIASIFGYLKFDAFEPLAFLITFLISSWGFVLLWKSDNDLRFSLVQKQIKKLHREVDYSMIYMVPAHLRKRTDRNGKGE